MKRILAFMFGQSVFLFGGAIAGVLWANLHWESCEGFRALLVLPRAWIEYHGSPIDLQFLVNDVLMVLFFGLAGKQVWEAMLPGGALSEFRRAATPIICAVGGMAGPSIIYVFLAVATGRFSELGRGWAIPCATDVAFSYVIARLIFPKGHPAIPFLLLLSIADDALGLIVLAVFYPQHQVALGWLALPAAAVIAGLLMRRAGVRSVWWYLLCLTPVSWIGLAWAGIHPALALLPIVPTLPHAAHVEHPAHWEPVPLVNTLERFAFWLKNPVEVILGLFALLNAGVPVRAFGPAAWFIVLGLLLGKPAGIYLTGVFSTRFLGLKLPEKLTPRELFVTGCAAGIGFTVALFMTTVAFPPGPIQDAAKMGALASSSAVLTTWIAARLLRVAPRQRG